MSEMCSWQVAALRIANFRTRASEACVADVRYCLCLNACFGKAPPLDGCFLSSGDSWGPRPPQKFRKSH
jgi:hypothetical protein